MFLFVFFLKTDELPKNLMKLSFILACCPAHNSLALVVIFLGQNSHAVLTTSKIYFVMHYDQYICAINIWLIMASLLWQISKLDNLLKISENLGFGNTSPTFFRLSIHVPGFSQTHFIQIWQVTSVG
jgi:hypothetical protein